MNSITHAMIRNDISAFKAHFDLLHTGQEKGRVSDVLFELIRKAMFSANDDEGYFALSAIDHIASYQVYQKKAFNWSNVPKMLLENAMHSNREFFYGDYQRSLFAKLSKRFNKFDINATYGVENLNLLMLVVQSSSIGESAVSHLLLLGANPNIQSKYHGRALHFARATDRSFVPKLEVLLLVDKDPGEMLDFYRYGSTVDNPFFKSERTKSSTGVLEGRILNKSFRDEMLRHIGTPDPSGVSGIAKTLKENAAIGLRMVDAEIAVRSISTSEDISPRTGSTL